MLDLLSTLESKEFEKFEKVGAADLIGLCDIHHPDIHHP